MPQGVVCRRRQAQTHTTQYVIMNVIFLWIFFHILLQVLGFDSPHYTFPSPPFPLMLFIDLLCEVFVSVIVSATICNQYCFSCFFVLFDVDVPPCFLVFPRTSETSNTKPPQVYVNTGVIIHNPEYNLFLFLHESVYIYTPSTHT